MSTRENQCAACGVHFSLSSPAHASCWLERFTRFRIFPQVCCCPNHWRACLVYIASFILRQQYEGCTSRIWESHDSIASLSLCYIYPIVLLHSIYMPPLLCACRVICNVELSPPFLLCLSARLPFFIYLCRLLYMAHTIAIIQQFDYAEGGCNILRRLMLLYPHRYIA